MRKGQSVTTVKCSVCQRGFGFNSISRCPSCSLCCDCCVCHDAEVNPAQEDDILWQSLLDLALRWSRNTLLGSEEACRMNTEPDAQHIQRSMIQIAIWPHTLSDDEIVFDPATGSLTDRTAQIVERCLHLKLNEMTRNTARLPSVPHH